MIARSSVSLSLLAALSMALPCSAQQVYGPPARQQQPAGQASQPNGGPRQYAPQPAPPQYPPRSTQQPGGYPPVRVAQAQQPAAQQGQRPMARPPFVLNPQEEALLDQVLGVWEQESDKVKSYKCDFDRFEYDPVFGPGDKFPTTKSKGHLRYIKPDKGAFRVDEVLHYTAPKQPGEEPSYEPRANDPGEHWVCDGEAVYEFNTPKKQLIVRPLPEEMRGKSIADGPLPFLFGAKKAKLKARYLMRVTRTTEQDIWLEAYPRWAGDAANFRRVEIILSRSEFLPKALQVYQPNGKSRTVYMFGDASVNGTLDSIIDFFQQPRTPFGWKKVIENPPPAQASSAARQQPGYRPQR